MGMTERLSTAIVSDLQWRWGEGSDGNIIRGIVSRSRLVIGVTPFISPRLRRGAFKLSMMRGRSHQVSSPSCHRRSSSRLGRADGVVDIDVVAMLWLRGGEAGGERISFCSSSSSSFGSDSDGRGKVAARRINSDDTMMHLTWSSS